VQQVHAAAVLVTLCDLADALAAVLVTEQWSGYCLASPTTLLLTLCRNAQ
jgi:hypothetical protein